MKPEPELMLEEDQARAGAYAKADFFEGSQPYWGHAFIKISERHYAGIERVKTSSKRRSVVPGGEADQTCFMSFSWPTLALIITTKPRAHPGPGNGSVWQTYVNNMYQ